MFLTIESPTVEMPPQIGDIALLSTTIDLGELGYEVTEYFLTGTATAFSNVSELGDDGIWEIEPGETAPYTTRVVVYQPQDATDFSGKVFIEWLNVTAGFDTAPSWTAGHTGMIREGHAWIGVSTQIVGIEGSSSALIPLHLKAANPERYASLSHPGDSFSYDIFSQVAQAVRHPGNMDILQGLQASHLLGYGQSQSGMRLVTYINAVHPLYNPFDAYLIHNRGGAGIALAQAPLVPISVPDGIKVRADLNVPVLNFQTETDVIGLGSISSRQEDSETFRLWETAGTAHAGYYLTIAGREDEGVDPKFALVVEETSVFGFIECSLPMNAGPHAWLFNAATDALVNWMEHATEPPFADRLAVSDDMASYQRDDLGNALGGVRSPYVDAPAAILSGSGQTDESFCRLFGTTRLFDAAQMAALYTDQAGYVQAVADATDDAIGKGFLLPVDGDRIKAAASLQWQMLGQ